MGKFECQHKKAYRTNYDFRGSPMGWNTSKHVTDNVGTTRVAINEGEAIRKEFLSFVEEIFSNFTFRYSLQQFTMLPFTSSRIPRSKKESWINTSEHVKKSGIQTYPSPLITAAARAAYGGWKFAVLFNISDTSA